MKLRSLLVPVCAALAACTYRLPPLSHHVESLPRELSGTGLYADRTLTRTAADVHPYTPSYELWSDGASKRRYIRLPQGARIDSANMDDWVFPVGTQLWKEFTSGGKRVETRLLQRVSGAVDGWAAAAYVWDADQREARLSVDGVDDTLETAHDVPEARACAACHAGRAAFVLGFSAVQLSHRATSDDEWTLDALVAAGLLSQPPTQNIRVPGDTDTRAALGYLHANCGNCHNRARPESAQHMRPKSELDLWLTTGSLQAPEATPATRAH